MFNKLKKMSRLKNGNKGFTLIEVLVVVLIIAVFAAIALPQYQKSVVLSQTRQPLAWIKNVALKISEYELVNGKGSFERDSMGSGRAKVVELLEMDRFPDIESIDREMGSVKTRNYVYDANMGMIHVHTYKGLYTHFFMYDYTGNAWGKAGAVWCYATSFEKGKDLCKLICNTSNLDHNGGCLIYRLNTGSDRY